MSRCLRGCSAVSVRIVFADMDDTFLHTDKTLVDENMAMLDRLAEEGIEFVPCTGRSLFATPEAVRRHPSVHHSVSVNGSSVYRTADLVRVHGITVGKERALALYGRMADLRVDFDVFADGRIFTERWRWDLIDHLGIPEYHRAFMKRSRTPVDLTVPQIVEQVGIVERIGVYWTDGDQGSATAASVQAAVAADPTLHGTTSMRMGMEILDRHTSKGEALAWLCEGLGIPRECSVAFGDSPNDIEMIRAAGDGVAMGNAYPEVKAVANHVTATNDEAGFARYLESVLG